MFFFFKNTNIFTFSGLRSGLLLQFENPILCCALSAARTFAPVLMQRVETRLYPRSACGKSASLHVISEIGLLLQYAAALQHAQYEAGALEQRRPCTRTSATTSKIYTHSQKMVDFARSLEPCLIKYIMKLNIIVYGEQRNYNKLQATRDN